jgi:hypothetical protein
MDQASILQPQRRRELRGNAEKKRLLLRADGWELFESFLQRVSQSINRRRRIAPKHRIGIEQHFTISRIHYANL